MVYSNKKINKEVNEAENPREILHTKLKLQTHKLFMSEPQERGNVLPLR